MTVYNIDNIKYNQKLTKYGYHYSVFINDLSNSCRYIIYFLELVKGLNSTKIPNITLVIHTDNFTLTTIKNIANIENIDLTNIQFVIHQKNINLQASLWRFYGIIDTRFMINYIFDIDTNILNHRHIFDYFEDHITDFDIVLHQNHTYDYTTTFDAGLIGWKSSIITEEFQQQFINFQHIISLIPNIYYFFDEYVLKLIVEARFKNSKILNILDKNKSYKQIISCNDEIIKLNKVYSNMKCIDWNKLKTTYKNNKLFNLIQPIKFDNVINNIYEYNHEKYDLTILNHGIKNNELMEKLSFSLVNCCF